MTTRLPRIALTAGEPAGIGPDLCLLLAGQQRAAEVIIIADPDLLARRAAQLELPFRYRLFDTAGTATVAPGELCILPVSTRTTVHSGTLDTGNARYVLDTLDAAIDGADVDGHIGVATM